MQKTLLLTDKTVRKIYQAADDELKAALQDNYPKGFFSQNILERVFTFEDACAETGRDPKDPFFSACRPHENANRKIEEVALALNEGVVLDLKDPNTEKWRVYVIWEPKISGFRLNDVGYCLTGTNTGLGSRTAFASREKAGHFAKYFMPLINESLA